MPICKGCGSSYDGSFKFCPHCGRAKPEPEVLKINVQVEASGYEEAILEVEWLRKTEIKEYPFDWRPNLIDKILGDNKKHWTEISHFLFSLKSTHKEKGEYVAFKSDAFRAFYIHNDDIKFPIPIKNMLSHTENGREWVEDIFLERAHAWKQFNTFLINNGWVGLTDSAINRIPPFYMKMHDEWFDKTIGSERGNWLLEQIGFLIIGIGHPDNPDRFFRKKTIESMENKYRYQRQIF